MPDSPDSTHRETVEIENREYQKYSIDEGIYHLPVDEYEEVRLVSQHRMMQNVFQDNFANRYFLAPLGRVPSKIMDCGFGQGEWAIEVAQWYPDSQITAVDIWEAELPETPDNLECEIHDLNKPLRSKFTADSYDLIQSRCIAPGIRKDRWQGYINDLSRLLKRNGWVQLVEFSYLFQSWSGMLGDHHHLSQWSTYYKSVLDHGGLHRDLRIGTTFAQKLRAAGFVDIEVRSINVDVGVWSDDPGRQRIGQQMLNNILGEDNEGHGFLDAHALWPFTQKFNWTAIQLKWFTDTAKMEARDPSLKLYMPLYIAWGRKP